MRLLLEFLHTGSEIIKVLASAFALYFSLVKVGKMLKKRKTASSTSRSSTHSKGRR